MLVVQKFGGSSVADKRIFNVARIVTKKYDGDNSVVVVVSAQGDTTDELIERLKRLTRGQSPRNGYAAFIRRTNIDFIARNGNKLGYPVVSLLG